jgi:predicted 3-demethylubiquinone-9 3-methyltransferase (glyoxalase superfamily)
MPSHEIVPCIWLDDQAEQAAAFYLKAFGDGRVLGTSHYPQSRDNPSGRPRGSVLTVDLELQGRRFTLLNGGPIFKPNPSVSFFAYVATPAAADRLYGELADGGTPLMPIGAYPWSERYGWIADRFGVSWQVMSGPRPPEGPAIAPSLMFVGVQHGRAEEAMRFYTGIFPGSRIAEVARYAAGEGPEGTVKRARFVLAGQDLVAMDGHGEHRFGFDEGVSLQVMCEDQAEVDRYWEALGAGGSHGPCGWLKDRFGLSWQVVPKQIATWMGGGVPAARDRAFQAVMGMGKLDVGAIERAFEGR